MDTALRDLLWTTLDEPHGIEVETNDPERFKRKFYTERKKAEDEGIYDFANISCRTSPTEPQCRIWLVNGDRNAKRQDGESKPPLISK